MLRTLALAFALIGALTGCGSLKLPTTPGDPKVAYEFGYTPVDSLPVSVSPTTATRAKTLRALPDETMRLAVGTFNAKTGLTFGVAKIGVAGNSYVVILDYTKFTTVPFGVTKSKPGGKVIVNAMNDKSSDIHVPVYVGVGLRLTASVNVMEGEVDLGNLFALGVAAQAKKINGTLVIQSLGLSGSSVSPLIPIPGEINATTIQNALVAIGSIKAKLYDADDTSMTVVPRVLGVYNTIGGGEETINSFIAQVLANPPTLEVK